ncbi:MAG: right-handed parallel beta-helix repeat-containing protein [Candidatus Didemnitutus sp.]|nr:right-handed parallel beta-helix repeat-containing protein [Candidatus Didemnitutus sp.]
MSYVRFDDQHEEGRLSQFRERLSGEIRLQTGDAFDIFQDRNDIKWGEQWQARIEDTLDAVTFLIPIITPGFFKSHACRTELERFLQREKKLKRGDLILPVYYVECPVLGNAAKRKSDTLAEILAARQYADWRELRFEPLTTPAAGKTLAQLATQVVAALERVPAAAKAVTPPKPTRKRRSHPATITAPAVSSAANVGPVGTPKISARTEPPTLIVDAMHRGDHPTLTAALAAAIPGSRILVRPGLYNEGVVIDKPVEIVGDGELGEIVIEATAKDVVLFKTSMGRIANLTLRQNGGERCFGIDIAQGRLEVEGCDITSRSLACVAIHDGADPRLRRNRIHDGKRSGIFVYENGMGTLEDNDIYAHALAGIEIKTGSNPTLRRNRIHDGIQGGVLIQKDGLGTLEDNDIFANSYSGVEITKGANPTLRRNRIHNGKQSGLFVHAKGQGTFEDNDIFANAFGGVAITEEGNPTFRRNRITKNNYRAIRIFQGGGGTFEDNDLRENALGAWEITADCASKVIRTRNLE